MEKITKHLPLTTIFIAYLFVCGSLYIIGFWTTFDIEITNFLNISEIPKSFILPFVLSNGLTFFQMIINFIASPIFSEEHEKEKKKEKSILKTKLIRILNVFIHLDMIFSYFMICIIYFYYSHKTKVLFWSISTIVFGILMAMKIVRNDKIKELIPKKNIRLYTVQILVFIPIVSFSTGKINSLNIYNNDKITLIEIIKDNKIVPSNKPNKLIGFIGEKLVISDLKNEKMKVINQTSFNEVELTKKK
jgi:hypothetical protein